MHAKHRSNEVNLLFVFIQTVRSIALFINQICQLGEKIKPVYHKVTLAFPGVA